MDENRLIKDERSVPENDHEEFECPECDYKSSNPSEMIDHSKIHGYNETSINDDAFNTDKSKGNNIENISNVSSVVTKLSEFESIKERNMCKKSTNTSDINGHANSDIQCNSTEEISPKIECLHNNIKLEDIDIDNDVNLHISTTNGNKKIKLEEIDIDHNEDSYFSPNQIIDNIKIEKNSNDLGLELPKTEVFCPRDEKPITFNHMNMFREVEILEIKTVISGNLLQDIESIHTFNLIMCKICNFSSRNKKLSYDHARTHIVKLGNKITHNNILINNYDYYVCTLCHIRIMSREDIQLHMQTHNSEQISNTIVDIKIIQTNVVKAKVKAKVLHCCQICDYAFPKYLGIVKHLKDHTLEEVDAAEKARYPNNLSTYSTGHFLEALGGDRIEPIYHTGGLFKRARYIEVVIDNTGIYIPDGWQRKVYQISKGEHKGSYKVGYISPFGNTLYSAGNIRQHIEWLKCNDITLSVDVDELDFSTTPHNLPKVSKKDCKKSHFAKVAARKRTEIEVDNTEIYIPEGWQRKVFRYTNGPNKGKHIVSYTSQFDKVLYSKRQAIEYVAELEKMGCYLSVDAQKLSFSAFAHIPPIPDVQIPPIPDVQI
ncbi:unnamed protein product [Meganyctiphanes norvegica]|uniref:C2H2-type domain-containing protein n=1 Tax=Meganyctiphanes norvegica TaxID=48144 RepID=A0AAV2R939_MEGNR